MNSVGIICEYNPFHNGHLFHLNKVKKLFPNETIVLIMSSSFLQRGEASIINKWDKTKIALTYGIDLVIELPFAFSTQSSDIFAKGSIELLKHLKIKNLVFGSESNDLNLLNKIANIKLSSKYNNLIKEKIKEGISYPSSVSYAIKKITKKEIKNPNDILGVNYITEIKKQNASIKPLTIKRINNYHSLKLEKLASATSIRKGLKENINIKKYVPLETFKLLNNPRFTNDYFPFLKYKILTEDNLNIFQTVDEGIENRIKKHINSASTLEDLVIKVKNKRWTYNRLMRMFTHILCNFKKEDAKKWKNIEYIRVLGFSKKGQQYLNFIKKDLTLPIVTNYSKINNKMLSFEYKVTCVYASPLNEINKLKLIKKEYGKPIIHF